MSFPAGFGVGNAFTSLPQCQGAEQRFLLLLCACQEGQVQGGRGLKNPPKGDAAETEGPAGPGCSAVNLLQLPALIISLQVRAAAVRLQSKNCPTFK